MILSFLFFLVLVIASSIVSMIFAYLFMTVKTKRKYTIKDILWPFKKEYTFFENLGELIMSPFAWIMFVVSVMFLLFITFINSIVVEGMIGSFGFLASGVAAYFFSTFYLLILYYADFVEREPPHYIIHLFLWGLTAALFSLLFESVLSLTFPPVCLTFVGVVFIAPVVEEFFKSLGVALVVLTPEVDDVVDGALYGGAVGLGFAFIENWMYFTSQEISNIAWVMVVVTRGLLSTVGHMVFTGTTGAVLAWAKKKFKHWYLFSVIMFLIGMVLHGTFNFIATVVESVSTSLIDFPVPVFLFSFVLILILSFGLFYTVSVLSSRRASKRKRPARARAKGRK